MKVKVRRVTAWTETVMRLPTATLQGIVRRHAQGDLPLSADTLFIILGELVRRREESGSPFRSNEEAWAEFVKYYLPGAEPSEEAPLQALQTPHELTPSPGGKECLGNGHWPGYACRCPDCDWYATICFPDWEGHKAVM